MANSKLKSEKTITPSGSSDNICSLTIDHESDEDMKFLESDLLYKMDTEDIEELKKYFFDEEKIKHLSSTRQNETLARGLALNKVDFIEVIEKLAGSAMVSLSASKLFETLDVNNENFITWENVLDALIKKGEEQLDTKIENWQPRESIVKVVPLQTKVTFCYAVVSKFGRVGVYDGELNLLASYKVNLKPSTLKTTFSEENEINRSQTTWVTDAVFVPDTYAIFFSVSDRSLHLYDATGLIHVPLCLIKGLNNTPTCLDYVASNDSTIPGFLFFGDDQGDVTIMEFHQPKNSLFKKKDPAKLDIFLWTELKEQFDYVAYRVHKRVHNETILQISYNSSSKTILTCSNDPVNTMILRHMDKKKRSYIFSVPRGIRCFYFEKSLHIIVTGSNDGLVRVWNNVVTKQPIISLHGHKAAIVDVKVFKHIFAIISLSQEGVLKIWHAYEYYCYMSLNLKFSSIKAGTTKFEFGRQSIYSGPTVTNFFEDLTYLNSKETSKINSFTEDIESWLSSRDIESKDQEWNRNSFIVVYYNKITFLQLNPMPFVPEDVNVPPLLRNHKILPPPSKELYASVPSPWKIADYFTKTPPESEDESTLKSSSSSSTKNMATSRTLKKVQCITADPVNAPIKNMNIKKTQLQIKQERMKMLVEHCAPHLALDLYDLAPIKFSRPLPVTRRMLEKGIDVSDPERFLRGKLQKDSTIITGETLSEALSSHSSKSSKLTTMKKNILHPKGRQTPDWFSERVKTFQENLPKTIAKEV